MRKGAGTRGGGGGARRAAGLHPPRPAHTGRAETPAKPPAVLIRQPRSRWTRQASLSLTANRAAPPSPFPSWFPPRLPERLPVRLPRQEVPGAASVAPQPRDRRSGPSSCAGQPAFWCLAAVSGACPRARHPLGPIGPLSLPPHAAVRLRPGGEGRKGRTGAGRGGGSCQGGRGCPSHRPARPERKLPAGGAAWGTAGLEEAAGLPACVTQDDITHLVPATALPPGCLPPPLPLPPRAQSVDSGAEPLFCTAHRAWCSRGTGVYWCMVLALGETSKENLRETAPGAWLIGSNVMMCIGGVSLHLASCEDLVHSCWLEKRINKSQEGFQLNCDLVESLGVSPRREDLVFPGWVCGRREQDQKHRRGGMCVERKGDGGKTSLNGTEL